MYNDVIADMFTRIRNSLKESHDSVLIPYSTVKFRIAQILKDNGFITSFDVYGDTLSKKTIKVILKYKKNGQPIITKLEKRI